jgi:hypothetical protein
VSHTTDLSQQLAIAECATLSLLISFVNDGGSIGVLEGVSIDAVERGVELTF